MKDRYVNKRVEIENVYPPRPTRAEKDRRIREGLSKLKSRSRSKPKENVVYLPKRKPA